MFESGGHDVLGHAVQPVRILPTPGWPTRREELVAPPTQQHGLGAHRLLELDLGPLCAVAARELLEPAAVPEALVVLDDSVERDVLADHDLCHFGFPFCWLSVVTAVRDAPARATAPTAGAVRVLRVGRAR